MKIIKKLLGLDKVEANIELANKMLAEAEAKQKLAEEAAVEAQQREELAKLTPKERATRKKEPWVGVLETHVNKDNVRNGFFELDWNELFVLKLRQEGYGADGDKDEEVVDRWFRELCANVVVDGDFGGVVTTGSLDPTTIQKNL
jgi:hypothetical protein